MSGAEIGPVELPSPGVPIKAWTRGVYVEDAATAQLQKTALLPIVHGHVAVMPDVHVGIGATVGTVVPTRGAIIPAAVGVDIGCGMMATRTSLLGRDLPRSLAGLRDAIERAIPHGRTDNGGKNDRGAWRSVPNAVGEVWKDELEPRWKAITDKHPKLGGRGATAEQLGTLGGGNHFVEVCIDEDERVWVMLHSGSRGVGNRTGTYFIERARKEMEAKDVRLPDRDLAWLAEGTASFDDYVEAVGWAQDYAAWNRSLMMTAALAAMRREVDVRFRTDDVAVNCHHNYVQKETHGGEEVWITRKGAVRAGLGDLGIIPGSMGAKSFIVRGLGNAESWQSCSHGAGRRMSRTQAKQSFTLKDHREATEGVECRKDKDVIDETPAAYKDIDAVMHAQRDLVEVVHTLKQVVCVKG